MCREVPMCACLNATLGLSAAEAAVVAAGAAGQSRADQEVRPEPTCLQTGRETYARTHITIVNHICIRSYICAYLVMYCI